MTEKQKLPRYEMHKYWGKKPAFGLIPLINRYSKEGDILLDPFAGYGVFCSEAYIAGRNIIVNDLNPIANFIEDNLLNDKVNITKVLNIWEKIKEQFVPFVNNWYQIEGISNIPITYLRSHDGNLIKARFLRSITPQEISINSEYNKKYQDFEKQQEIEDWYPSDKLIPNSRISAKNGMIVADLFTKRQLACHARLYKLIQEFSDGDEQKLLMLAFTANLANCSVLVPPIKSRGDMSQGAWMTGFYTGDYYLENNVLHYFENRLSKVILGKKDFYNCLHKNYNKSYYKIISADAKNLPLEDNSIDYIFTDPPYGDSVPYFEQSIIWNAWLKIAPDYSNEIVVSDSSTRNKDEHHFEEDIMASFKEIARVLKKDKYFSLTYHSLSGEEWKGITNACILNGFEMIDYEWLAQKTFTPRQLSRTKTVKGDILITLKNTKQKINNSLNDKDNRFIKEQINKILENQPLSTNDVMIKIMKWVFDTRLIINNADIYEILKGNFNINENGLWANSN